MVGEYSQGSVGYNVFGDGNGPKVEPHTRAQPNGSRNQAHVIASRTSVDGAGQPDAGKTEHADLKNIRESYQNFIKPNEGQRTEAQANQAQSNSRGGGTSGPQGSAGHTSAGNPTYRGQGL